MQAFFGAAPTLQQKVDTLRGQLALPHTDSMAETVDKAIEQLGLEGELKGLTLMQKTDACLNTLGSQVQQSAPLMMAQPVQMMPVQPGMAVAQPVMAQPVMAQPIMAVLQPVMPEPVVMQRQTGLAIVEARYGWAQNIWAASLGSGHSHGGGAKDVTDIVRSLVVNSELHINANCASQYMNRTFWAETSGGPAIPRKLAVRYSYDGGPTLTVETPAVPNETVPMHVTRSMQSEFHGMITTKEMEGCWICCCFPFFWWALFKKEATSPDTLKHGGCIMSPFLCPFEEHRMRIPSTNFFVKADGSDPTNIDKYSSSSCVCNGLACSMKLC